MNNIRSELLNIMEKQGFYIENSNDVSDINILEYIADSLEFVEFIVTIEEQLNVSFPDEYLTMSVLESLNGLVSLLESINNKEVG